MLKVSERSHPILYALACYWDSGRGLGAGNAEFYELPLGKQEARLFETQNKNVVKMLDKWAEVA